MIRIIKNDIHNEIKNLPDNSINLIYTNPPFGITKNDNWDISLRWDELFNEMDRVLKPDGKIILHCSLPFTYDLIKIRKPKYSYVWIKDQPTGFLSCNKQPLRLYEDILVWYKKTGTYNVQKIGNKITKRQLAGNTNYYGKVDKKEKTVKKYSKFRVGTYPTNVLKYKRNIRGLSTRPDELVDFIIKTYSNENDMILDLTCYNALTGSRCEILNRNYIGVDLNPTDLMPNQYEKVNF